MTRFRAAWTAFRNPDALTVVVHHDRITTQAAVTDDMAREIRAALLRVQAKQGRSTTTLT